MSARLAPVNECVAFDRHQKLARGLRPGSPEGALELRWDCGTIVLRGDGAASLPGAIWDPRISGWRTPACRHSEVLAALEARDVRFDDHVPEKPCSMDSFDAPSLRTYQEAAVEAWRLAGHRGLIVLPTGAGKTRTAIAAIAAARKRTLILVPTRVLVAQWIDALATVVGRPVGRYADGERDEQPITVATFASARVHAERLGNRFELLVVDEAHHFGGGAGDEVLEMCIASARLGLTATPPEPGPRLDRLHALVGPVVWRESVDALAGRFLAPLEIITWTLSLTPEERSAYDREVAIFRPACRTFFQSNPYAAWPDFVRAAQRTEEGRRALVAWRRSREVVRYPASKRAAVADLLHRHCNARLLLFTPDNATAYDVAREHLVQPITCDISARERSHALERFAAGELRVLVSARVLNEGVDVPAAEVAVLVGGRQGGREYVQRVGRVLRPAEGKQAKVFELLVRDTFEVPRAERHREGLRG